MHVRLWVFVRFVHVSGLSLPSASSSGIGAQASDFQKVNRTVRLELCLYHPVPVNPSCSDTKGLPTSVADGLSAFPRFCCARAWMQPTQTRQALPSATQRPLFEENRFAVVGEERVHHAVVSSDCSR